MTRKELDAVERLIAELDDEALIEVLMAPESDYRADTLQIARRELKRRGISEPIGKRLPLAETATDGRATRARRWWVAALLSVATAGLGQLYNGQVRKAVFYFAAPLALVVLAWLALSFGSGAVPFLALLAAALLVQLAGVLDAVASARRQGASYELKPYNHIVVYIAVPALPFLGMLLLRASVVQMVWIPSGTMLPTVQIGDRLFVNKLRYGMSSPFDGRQFIQWRPLQREDIVVFTSPVDQTTDLIKRVIAVAGDTVEVRSKRLYINGEVVPDPGATFTDPNILPTGPRDNFGPVTVPPGKFFAMGDNRDRSYDSRYWGFADARGVKGQATLVYWSWNSESHQVRWDRIGMSLR